MKYCPQCESEYKDEVEACADCDVPLVSAEVFLSRRQREKQEQEALSQETFVSVKVAENAFEADRLRAALEQEGIPVLVRTFHDTAYDGIYVAQEGWGNVEVPESVRQRAEQIVGDVESLFPEPGEEADEGEE